MQKKKKNIVDIAAIHWKPAIFFTRTWQALPPVASVEFPAPVFHVLWHEDSTGSLAAKTENTKFTWWSCENMDTKWMFHLCFLGKAIFRNFFFFKPPIVSMFKGKTTSGLKKGTRILAPSWRLEAPGGHIRHQGPLMQCPDHAAAPLLHIRPGKRLPQVFLSLVFDLRVPVESPPAITLDVGSGISWNHANHYETIKLRHDVTWYALIWHINYYICATWKVDVHICSLSFEQTIWYLFSMIGVSYHRLWMALKGVVSMGTSAGANSSFSMRYLAQMKKKSPPKPKTKTTSFGLSIISHLKILNQVA